LRLRQSQLKEQSASVTAVVHHGDVDEFTEGHKTLLEWIAANGYRMTGGYREIYHDWRDHRHATTEVQFPVERESP
jgi:effector-binding domain-containing protein